MKFLAVEAELLLADGWRDTTLITVDFRNFANATKNEITV
jgi:hypothetical protein